MHVLIYLCGAVCVCVCLCPADCHTDSIPLNYYNGLVMGLTEWLSVSGDQERARGPRAARDVSQFVGQTASQNPRCRPSKRYLK